MVLVAKTNFPNWILFRFVICPVALVQLLLISGPGSLFITTNSQSCRALIISSRASSLLP